jgi:bifunctional polynucleotide phosphatase/kinase
MWNEKVPEKLKQLHKDGYTLVIFSNQQEVTKGNLTVQQVISCIEQFIKAAVGTNIPIIVLVATDPYHYRKPATGMWDRMVHECFGNYASQIDMKNSIHVGDAAGRPIAWNGDPEKKKDFSCVDRKFALNVGIKFQTPEEFFLDQPECIQWTLDSYDVRKNLKNYDKRPYDVNDIIDVHYPELVLFTGWPACGYVYHHGD